tara:strand:- start:246 stop:611 length:366 start_codon:yes stop_codon:yes gene_type:complete
MNIAKNLLSLFLSIVFLVISIGVNFSYIKCPSNSSCCFENISCCSSLKNDDCCYIKNIELKFDFETPLNKTDRLFNLSLFLVQIPLFVSFQSYFSSFLIKNIFYFQLKILDKNIFHQQFRL